MNDQKAIVVVDSGCDVPKRVREKLDIRILPLRVIYPEKDYMDGVDIDPLMVYQRFPEEFPSTSTPSLAEVLDILEGIRKEGYEHVMVVTISSGLSGTFNTVRLAALEMEEKGLDVRPLDSRNISIGAGLLAIWAAKKLKDGGAFEEVFLRTKKKVPDAKVFFYMDTLKYLQRGGRIGRLAGMVGQVLKLKPVISCDAEGEYYTVAKIRGSKLGKIKMIEEVAKFCLGHHVWAVVEEGDAHEDAMELQKMLTNINDFTRSGRILFEQQITATMAVNTGPGLVGIAVLRDP